MHPAVETMVRVLSRYDCQWHGKLNTLMPEVRNEVGPGWAHFGWARNQIGLSLQLRKLKAELASEGIGVEFTDSGGSRPVTFYPLHETEVKMGFPAKVVLQDALEIGHCINERISELRQENKATPTIVAVREFVSDTVSERQADRYMRVCRRFPRDHPIHELSPPLSLLDDITGIPVEKDDWLVDTMRRRMAGEITRPEMLTLARGQKTQFKDASGKQHRATPIALIMSTESLEMPRVSYSNADTAKVDAYAKLLSLESPETLRQLFFKIPVFAQSAYEARQSLEAIASALPAIRNYIDLCLTAPG